MSNFRQFGKYITMKIDHLFFFLINSTSNMHMEGLLSISTIFEYVCIFKKEPFVEYILVLLLHFLIKAKQKYLGMFETQKSEN